MPDREQQLDASNRLGSAWVWTQVKRLALAGFCWITAVLPCRAETFTEPFDGPNPSWQVRQSEQGARTVTHQRSSRQGKDGSGEFLQIETSRNSQKVRVEHALPESRVLNELEADVWVKANTAGMQLNLRIVLPEYEDPDTGRPLALLILGDVLEVAGAWQQLTCRTDDKLVQERLGIMRARLKRPITPRFMKVDRVILTWPLSRGVNEVSLDELSFGPIVRTEEPEIATTAHEQESVDEPPVQVRLDRLEVEGKPFFPRLTPYHEEPLKDLAEAGFNVVWVPDYSDRALLTSVRREGLWAAATPPVPAGSELPSQAAGLMPFSQETRPIAFWMLGTRITPQTQSRLLHWMDQIQEADRKYRRPLAADVSGEERIFSRELDLLGISRHTIGSSLTLPQYRDWLTERGAWARPGSLRWTWIQTMPAPVIANVFEAHGIPLQLEPEQIRLQVYAALAAGVRGIGFWTPRALREDNPADQETRDALRQINWELRLMEPWLATTSAVLRIPVTIPVEAPLPAARPKSRFRMSNTEESRWERDAQNRQREALREAALKTEDELSAAVLRTDYGTLLLPMWLESASQFVPGKLAAAKVTITVPGIDETAAAWEITTTGVHNLDRERVSGGVKITLRNFDQTACILLTADQELVLQTRQRVAVMQEECARGCLALAERKLDRVRGVNQRLGEFGLRQPDAPQLLGSARELFLEAQAAVSQQDWAKVRQKSQQAMQMARILQRAHWEDAVSGLPSPVSSPLATSFQSLPAQARLAMQLANEQASAGKNLLPSGNFEDAHAQSAVGWKHAQDPQDGVQASAELYPEARSGKYCLRLLAANGLQASRSALGGREFVSYSTPPITVHAGHALRIAGWIKIPAELQSSQDGALIYDSLLGRGLALRFRETTDWQRWELVREVSESQDITVTLALTGLGEVRLDDLEVTLHPLPDVSPAAARGNATRPRPAVGLKRWPDLRRLNPLPSRGSPGR